MLKYEVKFLEVFTQGVKHLALGSSGYILQFVASTLPHGAAG